jgi:hypothetical protein
LIFSYFGKGQVFAFEVYTHKVLLMH